MLYFLLSILGILITLFFIIGTHEFAHFIAARLLGIKVLSFSIGFGKPLLRWQDKQHTEYVIAWLPLGGYVKMLDSSAGDVTKDEEHLAFNTQPFYKKIIVTIAGPCMNLFCAFLLYWILFSVGIVTIKPIIGNVTPKSIAALAGLKQKQEIIRMDHHAIFSWSNALMQLILHAGNKDQIPIEVKNITNQQIETHLLNLANWKMNELSQDPFLSIGIEPYFPEIPLEIGKIAINSPAAAKLKIGDKLVSINKTSIKDWQTFIKTINDSPGRNLVLTIERNNNFINIPITLGVKHNLFFQKTGYLGVGPDFSFPKELLQTIQYPPLIAFKPAFYEMLDLSYLNCIFIGKVITGKLSLYSLGGPLTIFQSAGDAFNYGIIPFLNFLAFLSISIAIINILPLPGLDGGHVFIQVIELILRRPLPQKILIYFYQVGFFIIFFILLQAVINDILRLFKLS